MLDERRALISTSRQLKILDLPSAVVTKVIHGVCSYDNGKNKRVMCPGLLDKDHVLVVSGGRRHLKIMNLTTGELIKTLKCDFESRQIESLFVSKNGSTAVTLNDCGVAVVWNMSTHDWKVYLISFKFKSVDIFINRNMFERNKMNSFKLRKCMLSLLISLFFSLPGYTRCWQKRWLYPRSVL